VPVAPAREVIPEVAPAVIVPGSKLDDTQSVLIPPIASKQSNAIAADKLQFVDMIMF
jgi:hypothetical protein